MEVVGLQEYFLQLPNGRMYLYKNVAVVEDHGKKEFAQAGDSGSIAYAADGVAIGLVIGGSPGYTFLSPLSTCLKAVHAELLT